MSYLSLFVVCFCIFIKLLNGKRSNVYDFIEYRESFDKNLYSRRNIVFIWKIVIAVKIKRKIM